MLVLTLAHAKVLASTKKRRRLTLRGLTFGTAGALIAAVGEIGRFPTAQLVSYLELDPPAAPTSRPSRSQASSP